MTIENNGIAPYKKIFYFVLVKSSEEILKILTKNITHRFLNFLKEKIVLSIRGGSSGS